MFRSDWGRCLRAVPALACAASLCSCNAHVDDQINSQIVASVNDRPITLSQLNLVTEGGEPGGRVRAIESLIDEELLVEGAAKQQVEREPEVVEAIDASRRQILARTFAEQALYPKQQVPSDEAHMFFEANPILFEHRKRFLLKNYLLDDASLGAQLTAELEKVHSDRDVRELLEGRGIKYATQIDTISADHLPLERLGEFEHAGVGDVMTARQGNGKGLLMLITDIQDDAPVSFKRARPYIDTYLSTKRNQQALNDYLSRTKANAKIVYSDTRYAEVEMK